MWSRLCDHAGAVPAVRRVLRASGSVPRQNGGHSSCMLILVPHSAHCADRGDLTGTVLGMVLDAPVVVQQQVPWLGSRNAWFRRWIHVTHHPGWHSEEFMILYEKWAHSAPEVDSRAALLAGTSSATAVACSILVFAGLTHLAQCSHDCGQSAESARAETGTHSANCAADRRESHRCSSW